MRNNLTALSQAVPAPSAGARITLLSLPLEIRLQIYKNLLCTTDNRVSDGQNRRSRLLMTPLSSALLCICKTIHSEATPILYKENLFDFRHSTDTVKWLNNIGRINTGLLRTLQVTTCLMWLSHIEEWLSIFNLLGSQAHGLKHFSINFPESVLGYQHTTVQSLAEIRSLELLELGGKFDEDWLAYLKGHSHARIVASWG